MDSIKLFGRYVIPYFRWRGEEGEDGIAPQSL